MSRSSLLARATTALGLVGIGVVPATVATAQDPPPPARPPTDDRFAALPVSSEVTAPSFAAGVVGIAGSATRTAPARTRVDVYRTPGPEQVPVPFAWALTDADGRFDLRALPGPLDDGQLHTLTAVVSTPGGAAVTSRIQVAWDRASGRWTRTEVGPGSEGRTSTRSIERGTGLRIDVPDIPQSATPSTKAAGSTTSSDCRPVTKPGAIIALPPADITTGALLVQPKLDANGNQAEQVRWKLESQYKTARTTSVENVDHVSLKADFGATFGGVQLGVSGERSLTSSSTSGADIEMNNFSAITTLARSNHVLGLSWRSWAQTWECIDYPRTYATGVWTYATAYLSLELADLSQNDTIIGQSRSTLHRLDIDPATKKYVRPCGASQGHQLYAVQPNQGFSRGTGTSQSFENGMTFQLGASVGGVQGSRTRSERSRVGTSSRAYTSWFNDMPTAKYLCGYEGRPSNNNVDPGFIVALGADEQ